MAQILLFFILFNGIVTSLFRKQLAGKIYFAPALLALGQAGYQFYKSEQQKEKARKLKNSNYIPQSVKDAETMSRQGLNSQAPGFDRGLQKIRQSTASTINSAARVGGTAGQVQQAVADSDAREKETTKDLAVSNAAWKAQQRDSYQNNLQIKGRYEKASYDAWQSAKSALKGAANQNQYNAITTASEGIVNSLPDSAFSDKTAAVTQTPETSKLLSDKRTGGDDYNAEDFYNMLLARKRKKLTAGAGNPYGIENNYSNFNPQG